MFRPSIPPSLPQGFESNGMLKPGEIGKGSVSVGGTAGAADTRKRSDVMAWFEGVYG